MAWKWGWAQPPRVAYGWNKCQGEPLPMKYKRNRSCFIIYICLSRHHLPDNSHLITSYVNIQLQICAKLWNISSPELIHNPSKLCFSGCLSQSPYISFMLRVPNSTSQPDSFYMQICSLCHSLHLVNHFTCLAIFTILIDCTEKQTHIILQYLEICQLN